MNLEESSGKPYGQRTLCLALTLMACLTMHPARGQTPTIEELEKRIDEAKKANKSKDSEQLPDGLLRDNRSGLIWSVSDNGQDATWGEASRYCKRRDMQLPTVGQLQKLVDHSERFHLSGYGYWSRQREGERWAVYVTLHNGRRSFEYVGTSNNFRALCVRGA